MSRENYARSNFRRRPPIRVQEHSLTAHPPTPRQLFVTNSQSLASSMFAVGIRPPKGHVLIVVEYRVDWDGVNIRKASQGSSRESDSVQYRAIAEIINDFEVVFDDDGSGGAADIVALRYAAHGRVVLRLWERIPVLFYSGMSGGWRRGLGSLRLRCVCRLVDDSIGSGSSYENAWYTSKAA